jgi:hypothetical protein
MMLLLLLLQASAPASPDIELRVQARAKSVTIEQKGEAWARVHAEPDAGSRVDSNVLPKAEGRKELRNVSVDIRARANIADPAQKSQAPETSPEG